MLELTLSVICYICRVYSLTKELHPLERGTIAHADKASPQEELIKSWTRAKRLALIESVNPKVEGAPGEQA
jgi:predicted GIY-YIG superfamily endonuclease